MLGRLILLAALALPFATQAATIVVIRGSDTDFSRRYFSGFSSAATERVSAFRFDASKEVSLLAQMKKLAPDVILTIGPAPVKKLSEQFPTTPLIISGSEAAVAAKKPNIVLMESEQTTGAVLDLAQSLFPAKKTIGAIYNPKSTQADLDALVLAAGKRGQKVASIKVDSAQDVKSFINAFAGKIDLFFWIRDATTSDAMAAPAITEFMETSNIPILSDDPNMIENGAALVLTPDPFRMGEQAWTTAKMILADGKIPQKRVAPTPAELSASVSLKALGRFGLNAETLHAFFQKTTKDGYAVMLRP